MVNLVKKDGSVLRLQQPNNIWWVNQGLTFIEESRGGFIRCRADDNLGHHRNLHYTNLNDVIIHYSEGYIRAISVVTKTYFVELGTNMRKNCCQYFKLVIPISKFRFVNALSNNINNIHIFDKNMNIKRGYLFRFDINSLHLIFPNNIIIG